MKSVFFVIAMMMATQSFAATIYQYTVLGKGEIAGYKSTNNSVNSGFEKDARNKARSNAEDQCKALKSSKGMKRYSIKHGNYNDSQKVTGTQQSCYKGNCMTYFTVTYSSKGSSTCQLSK